MCASLYRDYSRSHKKTDAGIRQGVPVLICNWFAMLLLCCLKERRVLLTGEMT